MVIPERIKILGLEWMVTRSKAVGHASSSYGVTTFPNQIINLEPDLTPLHLEQTLIHETLHAIFWSMGLAKLPSMDEKIEEQIVSGLANGIYAVIRDNPSLFKDL